MTQCELGLLIQKSVNLITAISVVMSNPPCVPMKMTVYWMVQKVTSVVWREMATAMAERTLAERDTMLSR